MKNIYVFVIKKAHNIIYVETNSFIPHYIGVFFFHLCKLFIPLNWFK